MTSLRPTSAEVPPGADPRPVDIALILTAVLALLGWWRGYDPGSPAVPWWSFIWLGPSLYAARQMWKPGLQAGRLLAAVPLLGFALLGWLEVSIGYANAWPWWLSHVAMGLLLFAIGLGLLSRGATWRFPPRLALFALAVLAFPWIGLGPLNGFWSRCIRLRPGMSVDQVVAVFRDCYVQNPDTQDGCDRSPVEGMRLKDWRTSDTIIFYPFDGSEEACTADGCWTWFEGGRLIRYWASPD